MRKRIHRPSPALVVACVALFVALGGVGYAAATIGTKDIKNGAVTGKKIKNKTITTKDINSKTVQSLRGATGPVGPQGATGAAGPTGPAGSARAYAYVSTSATFDPIRTKGFSAVVRVATGDYCLTPDAGLDLSNSVPAVSVDWSNSSGNNLSAFWRSSGVGCPAGDVEIFTFTFPTGGDNSLSNSVSFTVVVP